MPDDGLGYQLDTIREDVRRLTSALIAVQPLLSKPYPDAPELTPWDRFVAPRLRMLRQAVALDDLTPRTWSLPPEPGPEVKAVRDQDKHLWTHEPDGWIYRTGISQGGGTEIVYRLPWASLYRYHAPLTDATGEVDVEG